MRFRPSPILSIPILSLVLASSTFPNVQSELDQKFSELRAVAQEAMTEADVPGLAIGILHKGRTFTAGLGVTNVDHPLEVTPDTLFQVGSITKTMTGTILMRLVEEGKVDLDAPIQTYLPEFKVRDRSASETAATRHLLTHMGGWVGDLFLSTGEGDDALDRMLVEMADLPQLVPIGTVWSYNNAGYYAAGKVIESVTGKTFEEAFQEMLVDDLGLKNTFIRPADVMTHRFAVGHNVSRSSPRPARRWALFRAAYAAGGAIMTVGDMLQYAAFHLGDGTNHEGDRILSLKNLRSMQEVHATKIGSDGLMGLTWHLDDVGSVRTVSHGGRTNGQVSRLILVPEKEFALAVVTNANTGDAVRTRLPRFALDLYLGAKAKDPKPVSRTEAELSEYTGTYSRPFMDIHVTAADTKLQLKVVIKQGFPTPDTPLPDTGTPIDFQFFDKDRLIAVGGSTQAEFIREEGSVVWLRYRLRIHRKQ